MAKAGNNRRVVVSDDNEVIKLTIYADGWAQAVGLLTTDEALHLAHRLMDAGLRHSSRAETTRRLHENLALKDTNNPE